MRINMKKNDQINLRRLYILFLILTAVMLYGCGKKNDVSAAFEPESEQPDEKTQDAVSDPTSDAAADHTTVKSGAQDLSDKSGDILKTADEGGLMEEMTEDMAAESLKQISSAMNNFIWVALMTECDGDFSLTQDAYDIELSDAQKIRASVLATETDDVIDDYFIGEGNKIVVDEYRDSREYGEGYHGWSVPETEVDENCLDLFGTVAEWDQLQTLPGCDLFDAVKYTDPDGNMYGLWVDSELETETDMREQQFRIRRDGDTYIGEVDLFWGYWGELDTYPDRSNYTVTYTLVPSGISKYGLIISSIHIDKIKTPKSADFEDHKEAFYGIWTMASKNEADAKSVADKLISQGFDAQVFVSSDWSGLNADKLYVVTAGVFPMEEDARQVLKDVESAGYSGAYIKYTGEYIGD